MRIVLVSPFNIANYGAMLQGWALRTVLERMGHNVRHLNVPWMWHGVRNWWGIVRSRSITSMIKKVKINRMMRLSYETMGNPPMTRAYKSISELRRFPPSADCYIAGSDQIWAMYHLRNWENAAVVMLDFGSDSVSRIAYAPSIGKAKWTNDEISFARQFKSRLSLFKALSSREGSGCRLVSAISDRFCSWVPDPTLLIERDDYLNLVKLAAEDVGSGNHIFTYSLGFEAPHRRVMIDNVIDVIKRNDAIAKEVHRLRAPAPLGDWLLKLITARFVVTNSFHGLCFSLIFHRPFVMVGFDGEDGWRNERVMDLLGRLGLSYRFVASYNEATVMSTVAKNIDWISVGQLICESRQVGMDYIRRNVS